MAYPMPQMAIAYEKKKFATMMSVQEMMELKNSMYSKMPAVSLDLDQEVILHHDQIETKSTTTRKPYKSDDHESQIPGVYAMEIEQNCIKKDEKKGGGGYPGYGYGGGDGYGYGSHGYPYYDYVS